MANPASRRTIRPNRPIVPGRPVDVAFGGTDPDIEDLYKLLADLKAGAAQIGTVDIPAGGFSADDVLVFIGGQWVGLAKTALLELGDLSDVVVTSPVTDHVLQYDGADWVNDYLELDQLSDVAVTTPATAEVLRYNGVDAFVNALLALDDLSDAVITTPADGEVLTYDSGTSKWINEALPAGVEVLDDLADVDDSLAADGDFLTYSSGSDNWAPANWTVRDFGVGAAPTLAKLEVNTDADSKRGIVVRGFLGQAAALLQVRDVSDNLTLEVGVDLFGVFGATAVGQQTGASAAGIAAITDANALAAVSALQTALSNLGFVTSPA